MISNKFYLKFHLILLLYMGVIIKLYPVKIDISTKVNYNDLFIIDSCLRLYFFFINYFKLLSVTYKDEQVNILFERIVDIFRIMIT